MKDQGFIQQLQFKYLLHKKSGTTGWPGLTMPRLTFLFHKDQLHLTYHIPVYP